MCSKCSLWNCSLRQFLLLTVQKEVPSSMPQGQGTYELKKKKKKRRTISLILLLKSHFMSDHGKWRHSFKVHLVTVTEKKIKIEAHLFSWEIGEILEAYLIQQFESLLAVFLVIQVEGMCVHGSPDLLLTLITLGLIQASPLLQT